jgi:hypothetical protein
MIHEIVTLLYRLIVALVLAATVWTTLDRKSDLRLQLMAAVLTIPLALRLLMIK